MIPAQLIHRPIWQWDRTPIWLSSSLILQRNLANHIFPSKQTESQMRGSLLLLSEALTKDGTIFLPAEKLSSLDKELLFEHFLCLEGFQHAGAGQGWVIEPAGDVIAFLNINNHLQLHKIDVSADLDTAWSHLSSLEREIGKKFKYAFSPKFGYLTSDPTECGTALQVVLYLHVPALSHTGQLAGVLPTQKEEEVIQLSLEGPTQDFTGDILILKNRYTLGLSEETLLHTLQSKAIGIVAAEQKLRQQLKQNGDPAIKDLVSRAFGLLLHSYQLQTKEALSGLSGLKLGVDLGWITGISAQTLNTLFFQCRHAHLAYLHHQQKLDDHALPHLRAAWIQKGIEGASLNEGGDH